MHSPSSKEGKHRKAIIYSTTCDGMLIKVQTRTGKNIDINVKPTDTILNIKEFLEEIEGFHLDQQRFVAYGQILTDWFTVEECFLTEGCVIHLVVCCRSGRKW